MEQSVSVFSSFSVQDLSFLGEAALRTLWISFLSIATGSFFGVFFTNLLKNEKAGILKLSSIDLKFNFAL